MIFSGVKWYNSSIKAGRNVPVPLTSGLAAASSDAIVMARILWNMRHRDTLRHKQILRVIYERLTRRQLQEAYLLGLEVVLAQYWSSLLSDSPLHRTSRRYCQRCNRSPWYGPEANYHWMSWWWYSRLKSNQFPLSLRWYILKVKYHNWDVKMRIQLDGTYVLWGRVASQLLLGLRNLYPHCQHLLIVPMDISVSMSNSRC